MEMSSELHNDHWFRSIPFQQIKTLQRKIQSKYLSPSVQIFDVGILSFSFFYGWELLSYSRWKKFAFYFDILQFKRSQWCEPRRAINSYSTVTVQSGKQNKIKVKNKCKITMNVPSFFAVSFHSNSRPVIGFFVDFTNINLICVRFFFPQKSNIQRTKTRIQWIRKKTLIKVCKFLRKLIFSLHPINGKVTITDEEKISFKWRWNVYCRIENFGIIDL